MATRITESILISSSAVVRENFNYFLKKRWNSWKKKKRINTDALEQCWDLFNLYSSLKFLNCVELFSVSNRKKYIHIFHVFLWNISLTLSNLLDSYFRSEFVGILFHRLKYFFNQKFCQAVSKRPLLTNENIQTILNFRISKPPKTYFKKSKK